MVDSGAQEQVQQQPIHEELRELTTKIDDPQAEQAFETLARNLEQKQSKIARTNLTLNFMENQKALNYFLQLIKLTNHNGENIKNTGALSHAMDEWIFRADNRRQAASTQVKSLAKIRNPGYYHVEHQGKRILYSVALAAEELEDNQLLLLTSKDEKQLTGEASKGKNCELRILTFNPYEVAVET